jgi:hypothetical protein
MRVESIVREGKPLTGRSAQKLTGKLMTPMQEDRSTPRWWAIKILPRAYQQSI